MNLVVYMSSDENSVFPQTLENPYFIPLCKIFFPLHNEIRVSGVPFTSIKMGVKDQSWAVGMEWTSDEWSPLNAVDPQPKSPVRLF
ncbi:hypothetical protein AVEN_8842-1 [Araneus ventricosus]|uniref:Uncharacterized protein n=1 Tax=Araneus ventricosus TaxID=182803 RepID=A0A4Y2NTY3_ARAVE|nr:hypothetical protein AVEN_8842-1 [Araneus ventricosus]